CDISRRSRRHPSSITSPARLTNWSGFDFWNGAVGRWWWCVRRTQCRVIVTLGDRWRHRIGRFRFEWSGVKCCSKKADCNLLAHRRPLRQASSRIATPTCGEGKTKGVESRNALIEQKVSAFAPEADVHSTDQKSALQRLPIGHAQSGDSPEFI